MIRNGVVLPLYYYNAYVWKKNCQEIVKRGNLAKFSQSPQLMEYLLGTGDRILVEASPKDTVWGIGLAENAPEACNPLFWQGENLLGFTLMDVRDMLRGKYVSVPQNHYLTARQMETIRYGHIPDAMEDHWYMYCDEKAIHYLRSWTGICIVEGLYEKCGKEYRITEVRINNNPNEYKLGDADEEVALFYALLVSEYGGDASAYWNATF